MMYIPQAMDPIEHYGEEARLEALKCNGCGAIIPAPVGIVYERVYELEDGPEFGDTFWCSYHCLLETMPGDGNA